MSKQPNAWQGAQGSFASRAATMIVTAIPRMSGHYSCVGHARWLWAIFLLWQAKACIREVLRFKKQLDDKWPKKVNADSLDTLATGALRGVRVCSFGLGPLRPNPKLALHLAGEGLEMCDEETSAHTEALLWLDTAEAWELLEVLPEARECAREASRVLLSGLIDDMPQEVRVRKRLGAFYVRSARSRGEVSDGWILIQTAEELAKEVAEGQVEKIKKMKVELRRPWYHPMKLLIRLYFS